MFFNLKNFVNTLFIVLFFSTFTSAQISSVDSDGVTTTHYSSGSQDNIYIFCTAPGESAASLTAQASGTASYEWSNYNPSTGSFVSIGENSSEITNLADGAYRVQVTSGGTTRTYTAWVFNSWYTATAEITESTCDYFQLNASFEGNEMVYYDLNGSGQQLQVNKGVSVKWEANGEQISSFLSPQIFNPPAEDTNYTLTVSDDFGCEVQVDVYYNSIVTVASFTATPTNGEAPLEVTFNNESLNADESEWFFFKDIYELMDMDAGDISDSILDKAVDQNPIFIYDHSGTYNVKLVTTKYFDDGFCSDTVFIEDYILVDTSFVEVPNVFTPNGDGANDEFVISYWSLKEIKVEIFNRWGRRVFQWEDGNVQGYEETVSESVWDGKIGGKYASPGVYYYVIEAIGRDDERRNAHGFVHLLRGR